MFHGLHPVDKQQLELSHISFFRWNEMRKYVKFCEYFAVLTIFLLFLNRKGLDKEAFMNYSLNETGFYGIVVESTKILKSIGNITDNESTIFTDYLWSGIGENGTEVILSESDEKTNKKKIEEGYQKFAFNEFVSSMISAGKYTI